MPFASQRFGEFELVSLVARGGGGEVWRARHVHTQGDAAIKLMDQPDDPRWAREVMALRATRHPGLVAIYDAGATEEHAWIASAWMEGGTLVDHPVTDWVQLRELLEAMLDVLAFAHATGILHRDLKPGNILRHQGSWRLTDFGIARDMQSQDATRPQGTPFYVAPEQIAGRVADQRPWTDLYSLACVAWEQVTGTAPFTGSLAEILQAHQDEDAPPFVPRFDVPAGFETWLRVLLRKDGRRRALFAADALCALKGLGPPMPTARPRVPYEPSDSDTIELGDYDFEPIDDPPTEPPRMSPAPLPEMPSLAFQPITRETPLLAAISDVPIAPIEAVFRPLWQRLHHAHRHGRGQVVWHDGGLAHRMQTTWVTLWAAAAGQPGASLKDRPVRSYLRYAAGGAGSLVEGVRSWARCSVGSAERIAAALDDDAPYDAKTIAEFLVRVARVRGLIVEIGRIDRDPERLQLAAALVGAKAPLLAIAYPERDRTPVPGASELAPVLVDEPVLVDWLTRVAPIDGLTAQRLARGRSLGEAWKALSAYVQARPSA